MGGGISIVGTGVPAIGVDGGGSVAPAEGSDVG